MTRKSRAVTAAAMAMTLSAPAAQWTARMAMAQEGEPALAPAPAAGSAAPVDVMTEQDRVSVAAQAQASGGGAGTGTHLDQFMSNKAVQQFTGKPITLQVRDVEAADVFRLIGEASGFNIILGEDVKGKLTLSMVDVPWDQALDVVLHTLHLGAERNNNILRIMTLDNMTAEKQAQLRAQKAAEASAPRVTKVFRVNYASLKDLQETLEKFVSAPAQSGGVAASTVVQLDNRTNSLIVRDFPENIERIQKLIEVLDQQTPQVLVEAKIIEATEGFSKSISGQLGIGETGNSKFATSFGGGNPLDALLGSSGVFSGSAFGELSNVSNTPSGQLGVSFLPRSLRINALLNLGETESQVKVVASPKTVVVNKGKATIVQGTPVLVAGTTTVEGVGTVPMNTVQSANLSLDVTPSVTNDGGVLMDLMVTRDTPQEVGSGLNGIAGRNLKTSVLVDTGSTLVIGGIYTMGTSETSAGFPFLRKIPILGALFGSEANSTTRSELFIFITPRILNPKESGLSG